MNQQTTEGIMLQRTEYGEADRILTVLTPAAGKLHLMAKGARRVRSKLAGGIELFSVSELSYTQGKGSLGALVSARLRVHFERIVQDIDRTMLGYDLIRYLHKTTEDEVGPEYFSLMKRGLQLLNDPAVPADFTHIWFSAQLLALAGHMPNLTEDKEGAKLQADQLYLFDFEAVCFAPAREGQEGALAADSIKYLRLLFSDTPPKSVAGVAGAETFTARLLPLITTLRQFYLSV